MAKRVDEVLESIQGLAATEVRNLRSQAASFQQAAKKTEPYRSGSPLAEDAYRTLTDVSEDLRSVRKTLFALAKRLPKRDVKKAKAMHRARRRKPDN